MWKMSRTAFLFSFPTFFPSFPCPFSVLSSYWCLYMSVCLSLSVCICLFFYPSLYLSLSLCMSLSVFSHVFSPLHSSLHRLPPPHCSLHKRLFHSISRLCCFSFFLGDSSSHFPFLFDNSHAFPLHASHTRHAKLFPSPNSAWQGRER